MQFPGVINEQLKRLLNPASANKIITKDRRFLATCCEELQFTVRFMIYTGEIMIFAVSYVCLKE
jgi:hypothetical protein